MPIININVHKDILAIWWKDIHKLSIMGQGHSQFTEAELEDYQVSEYLKISTLAWIYEVLI